MIDGILLMLGLIGVKKTADKAQDLYDTVQGHIDDRGERIGAKLQEWNEELYKKAGCKYGRPHDWDPESATPIDAEHGYTLTCRKCGDTGTLKNYRESTDD